MAIGNDPTGYMRVDSGWVKEQEYGNSKYSSRAVADGGITDGSPIVADTGEVNVALAFDGTHITVDTGVTVTMVIPHTGTVNTTESNHSIVVTDADGGNQTTGALLGTAVSTSNGTNVTIVWTSGTDALGTDATGTITILSDIDEPEVTIYSAAINVTGATYLKTVVPTTSEAEVLTRWEYTNEDRAGGSTSDFAALDAASWTGVGSYAQTADELTLTPEDTADWDILRAMTRIRLAIKLGDLDVDGVAATAALNALGAGNTTVLVGNKPPQVTLTGLSSVGGIGSDPS